MQTNIFLFFIFSVFLTFKALVQYSRTVFTGGPNLCGFYSTFSFEDSVRVCAASTADHLSSESSSPP